MSDVKEVTYSVITVELELSIAAAPSRVWDALFIDTPSWWRSDFNSNPDAQRFVFEPHLGGRAYEDWGGGAGLVWYTVAGLDPLRMLLMRGDITPAYGGPRQSLLQITFEAAGEGTTLRLSDTLSGRVDARSAAETREGWRILFEDGLKAYVEAKG
jgi:uncharacterized protein YndB with AHSA1/START domain